MIKKMIGMIVAVFMSLGFCCGCGDNNTTTYSLPDIKVGETFEIILPAGGKYSWTYKIKPVSGIEYVSREFTPPGGDPDKIGGGNYTYTFKATKIGSYRIKFELAVSWESTPPIETNIYKITVIKKS